MSRRLSFLFPLLITICLALLNQCGSSGEKDGALGRLPAAWAKYLALGTITATLDVYQEDGEKELSLDLGIDAESGQVTSTPFKLGLGQNYRFIVTFHYAVTTQASVPYAYADFSRLVQEIGQEITFTENDIRYGHDVEDPSIATDLSRGILPDLDLDRDGWTNWEELRDKVDPQNGNSVPIPPTVEVTGLQDGTSSSATITIVARDNAHVEELRLVDPLCGVTIVSDTIVTNVDGSVTRTLIVRLDLLSVRGGSRALQAVAEDGVTPSQDDNEVLQFSLSGSASQPYFVFTVPEENSELEGPTVFRGVACSRGDVLVSSLKFLNSEISELHWSGFKNELTGDYLVESDAADTTRLPDGLNILRVELKDSNNRVGQGSGNYVVANDSQIKVVNPQGRRWVFGNEQVAVTVKDLPDSNIVIAETSGDFRLTSSTAGGLVGVLNVSNLEEGTTIPIRFKAVRSDGSEITRTVDFTVRNKPQIEVFPKASKVFKAWSTELQFRVTNVSPDLLALFDGAKEITASQRQCGPDSIADRVTVCTGTFPAKVIQSSHNFKLAAQRAATAGEQCLNCGNEKTTILTLLGQLAEDLPEINVAIDGDDEPVVPSRLRVSSESPAKNYRLIVKDLATGNLVFQDDFLSGETVPVPGLSPRTDYRETLQIFSGPGGNVEGEMFKDVTTGDIGLVAWWRFKDDSYIVDCPGETAARTVCDYSGKNFHGIPHGVGYLSDAGFLMSDGALSFDGIDDYVEIPNAVGLNTPSVSLNIVFLSGDSDSTQHYYFDNRLNGYGYNLRAEGAYPKNLLWIVKSDGIEEDAILESDSIVGGSKYVVTATVDGSLNTKSMYLQGEIIEQSPLDVGIDRNFASDGSAFFSNRAFSGSTSPFFSGSIEEIIIYSKAFCPHEAWSYCTDWNQEECGLEPAPCS